MPRHIDASQIRYTWMIDADGEEHDGVTLQSVIDKVPTADVVPRSEYDLLKAELELRDKSYADINNAITRLENLPSTVAREIVDLINLRIDQTNNQARGVCNDFGHGIYEGKRYAYRDIKEIIEQRYLSREATNDGKNV